jgi:ABC-2 type transport system ATP-binding protein
MAIAAKNISKSFGKFKVLENLDINVKKGTVHGFLGPNGAGKTTAIKVLLGLISPDSAEIEILGHDLFVERDAIMSKIGAIVEAPAFFEYLTAWENLYHLSKLSFYKVDKTAIEKTLETVGLSKVRNKQVRKFSYGMKQRLGIAQALLPDNKLIFLDEPVNGLDPHGIVDVRNLIRRICKEHEVTVFLSSHLLSEVEQTCDSVTIIDKGCKVCEGKVSEIMERHECIEIVTPDAGAFKDYATAKGIKILSETKEKNGHRFLLSEKEERIPELAEDFAEKKIKIFRLAKHKKILEDIFVELTNSKDNRPDNI